MGLSYININHVDLIKNLNYYMDNGLAKHILKSLYFDCLFQ